MASDIIQVNLKCARLLSIKFIFFWSGLSLRKMSDVRRSTNAGNSTLSEEEKLSCGVPSPWPTMQNGSRLVVSKKKNNNHNDNNSDNDNNNHNDNNSDNDNNNK